MLLQSSARRTLCSVTVDPLMLSTESLNEINREIAKYPEGQARAPRCWPRFESPRIECGWLSADVMEYVADLLEIEPVKVADGRDVFTPCMNLAPVGRYKISLCTQYLLRTERVSGRCRPYFPGDSILVLGKRPRMAVSHLRKSNAWPPAVAHRQH